MSDKDVERLLKGRAIIDAYREERAKGIDKSAQLADDLKALDFNSIDEFFQFNDDMCIKSLKKLNIKGRCDLCKGYAGIPECQVALGNRSCAASGIALTEENMYKGILYRLRLGAFEITDKWKDSIDKLKKKVDKDDIHWFCREGGGFYCKPVAMTPGKFPLTWN